MHILSKLTIVAMKSGISVTVPAYIHTNMISVVS